MKNILAAQGRRLLQEFAWSNLLVAFDYDGTLAPIVSDRSQARMRARTRALFSAVCRKYPCAVISGRGRNDVLRRLDGTGVRRVVGNHGLEPGTNVANFEAAVAWIRPRLADALAPYAGVEIEDKRYSLAIHYRRSRAKRIAKRAILAAVAAIDFDARIIPGKLVIDLLPRGAPHKGVALERVRRQERADTAIYVGDDVTDEDVFELDQPGRLLCIRVGELQSSAAQYFVRDQHDVDALLAELARLRTRDRATRKTA